MAGSNNIILWKFNAKPYGFDKMYMDKEIIEVMFYQLIDQFNKRKIIFNTFKQNTSILWWKW